MVNGPILVLDIGSSRAKASVLTGDGLMLAQDAAPYATDVSGVGVAEQEPAKWWSALCRLVPRVLYTTPLPSVVVVTGQMHGALAVGKEGHVIGPYYTLRDKRCLTAVPKMHAAVSQEEVYEITGSRLSAAAPAAKIVWLQENRSASFDAAEVFLSAKDYIRWLLTGEFATDPLEAAGMLLYDLRRGTWSERLLAAWQIPVEKLPPIAEPTDLAGSLMREPARALGLKAGTPVVVGTGDDVEFLGAGLLEPGQGLEHLGTTGSVLVCTDALQLDSDLGLEVVPHLVPNRWLVGGSTSAAGASLRWLADILGLDHLPTPSLGAQGRHQPLLIPHLAGARSPLWDPDVHGVFVGLSLGHDRTDLIRGAFEGVAFSLKCILKTLETAGLTPSGLVVADSSSRDWCRLRADVYGVPLLLPKGPDATALGAMIVAGVGTGMYRTIPEAVRHVTQHESRVNPDPASHAHYERRYRVYAEASLAAQRLEKRCS